MAQNTEYFGPYRNSQLCCDVTLTSRIIRLFSCFISKAIGIFESPNCDVNPQPNKQGIGPLVGRTSGNHHSVMHVFVVILSLT